MERLTVWAERLEGFMRVGTLSIDLDVGERFEYDQSYLQSEHALPIYPPLAGRPL